MSSLSSRYSEICDNFNLYHYHILGCGAIGSATATQLVRMGAKNLFLYDMDKVAEENIGVSSYDNRHIGQYKADALKEICLDISENVNINCYNELFKQYRHQGNDIVILAFDSMEARLSAVKSIISLKSPEYLIDGRMGAEHYQQYTLPKPSVRQYLSTWYSDEDGSQEPCNAKATSYCSNMSGSFISNVIRKILTDSPYHKEMSFDFPTNIIKTKYYTTKKVTSET